MPSEECAECGGRELDATPRKPRCKHATRSRQATSNRALRTVQLVRHFLASPAFKVAEHQNCSILVRQAAQFLIQDRSEIIPVDNRGDLIFSHGTNPLFVRTST